MGQFIEVEDVMLFNQDEDEDVVEAMISDAEALATAQVPELLSLTDERGLKSIKAILRQAINRWIEAGSGAVVTESAGPFAQTLDTRALRRGTFFNAEIQQMATIAGRKKKTGKAFSIDMAGFKSHVLTCSIHWSGPCSCGLADVGAVL